MREYLNAAVSWEDVRPSGLKRPAAGFVPVDVRAQILARESFDAKKLVPYLQRPFDSGYAYVSQHPGLWKSFST